MRIIGCLTALILCIATSAPALATGTFRVQGSDGAVRVYRNVSIKIVHQTLRVTSADGAATFVINHAACAYDGYLERCTPIKMSLERGSTIRSIDFTGGTIYVNPTRNNQRLPRSSTQLPPHGILLSIRSTNGTYVSLNGQIDGLVR
jgi:hypothetical protein